MNYNPLLCQRSYPLDILFLSERHSFSSACSSSASSVTRSFPRGVVRASTLPAPATAKRSGESAASSLGLFRNQRRHLCRGQTLRQHALQDHPLRRAILDQRQQRLARAYVLIKLPVPEIEALVEQSHNVPSTGANKPSSP